MATETMGREANGTLVPHGDTYETAAGIFLEGLRSHLEGAFGFDKLGIVWCEGGMAADWPVYEFISFTYHGKGWTWTLEDDDVVRDDRFDVDRG